MLRLLPLTALALAAPALAAEKRIDVGSFERVRVEGPFEVRISTGQSPAVRASGDARLIQRLEADVNGTTLVLRLGEGEGWESTRSDGGGALVIALSTPRVVAVTNSAGGRVTVDRVTGTRADLAVTGAGTMDVATAQADQLMATLVGTGRLTVGGRVGRARLASNGSGLLDAGGLSAGDLQVRQDGTGETRGQARFTAQITATGLGSVDIGGTPKCQIAGTPAGRVRCGADPRSRPAR